MENFAKCLLLIFTFSCESSKPLPGELIHLYTFPKTAISPSVFVEKEVVLFGDKSNHLVLANLKTGKIILETLLKESLYKKPRLFNGTIVAATFDGNFYMYSKTGEKLISRRLPGRVKTELTFYKDEIFVLVRGYGLVSFNTANFEEALVLPSFQQLTTTETVVESGLLYVGDFDEKLVSYLERKAVKWQLDINDHLQSAPVLSEKYVYIGVQSTLSEDSFLITIDKQDGSLVDTTYIPIDIRIKPIILDHQLLYQSTDKNVSSISLEDGRSTGFQIDGTLLFDPIAVYGKFILGFIDGRFLVIDPSGTESMAHRFRTKFGPTFVRSDSLYLVADNKLFLLPRTEL